MVGGYPVVRVVTVVAGWVFIVVVRVCGLAAVVIVFLLVRVGERALAVLADGG